MSMKTFAVFPDRKFKYGGYAYIGFPDMSFSQVKDFVKENTFDSIVKVPKLGKCFDKTNFFTVMYNRDKRAVYMLTCRLYPPLLWSSKRIVKGLEECFDECRIE